MYALDLRIYMLHESSYLKYTFEENLVAFDILWGHNYTNVATFSTNKSLYFALSNSCE